MDIAGVVAVKVKTDLTALGAGLAEGERKTREFDQRASSSFRSSGRAARDFGNEVSGAMRRAAAANDNYARSFDRVGAAGRAAMMTIRVAGAAVAAAIASDFVRVTASLVDSSTRITNSLKVAGLSGTALSGVYGQLYLAAQRNAAPLESLVELYSRASLVQKELGASSRDLIQFTDKIAVSLRVSGKSAQESSGALLQLSQLLGSSTVRADEFNSVQEGALPVLQAVAAGLVEAGGSVAKLRQLVVDGKVSSEAFFRAFLAGSSTLETRVQSARMTFSQAWTVIVNALTDAIGKFDQSAGASQKFVTAMLLVAKAIEDVGKASDRMINGPFGKFYAMVGDLIDRMVQLGADFGAATGLDQFGGNPYIGQRRIQERIDGAFAGEAYTTPKTGRLGSTAGGDGTKKVSINDHPTTTSADAAKAAANAYRDVIKAANDRIGQMRVELQTVGMTGAAVEALRFEQQLLADAMDKGRKITPEQRKEIHSLAQAYGELADAIQKASLRQDLMFEREQIFRSENERGIAARLRGSGLGMDSDEARWMRDNLRYDQAKDLAKGFLSAFQQELVASGGNIGKALGAAILSAATDAMNKQLEAIFDRLASWFASALTGVVPGGALSGSFAANTTLSAILGGGAANDNFAPPRALSGIGSPAAATGMSAFRDAIASIESAGSGGYGAIGPTHKTLGRALGRYQVMEANIGPWSKEALGRSITASEFMANPGMQDQIFDHRFGGYVDKYGASGAASMWFTGRPNAPNARDVLGTSGSQYVDKFNTALDKASSTVGHFDTGITDAIGKVTEMGSKWFGSDSMWKSLASPDFKANTTLSAILGAGGGGSGAGAGAGAGGGLLSSLFKGIFSIFGFANGTENAPAGWAWVGERGPELRKLRAGDVIRSNGRSQQMVGNENRSNQLRPHGKVDLHVHIHGANGDDHVRSLARQGAQEVVSEYHDAQVSGGFGEMQRAYSSQKG